MNRRHYAPQYRDIRPDRDTLYLLAGEEYRQRRGEIHAWYSMLAVGAVTIAAIVLMFWHAAETDAALETLMQDERASAVLFYGGAQ